jgi:hypothetical protein
MRVRVPHDQNANKKDRARGRLILFSARSPFGLNQPTFGAQNAQKSRGNELLRLADGKSAEYPFWAEAVTSL